MHWPGFESSRNFFASAHFQEELDGQPAMDVSCPGPYETKM
jgi:hypothetical protein